MITENLHTQNDIVIEQQFAQIDAIINSHRNRAIANVNIENLLTYWEIGQYISYQLQHSLWGSKVVGDLADYLSVHNPKQRGFGKRHLYNMVKFYDLYSSEKFELLINKLPLDGIVQLPIAQLENPVSTEIVQSTIAQFGHTLMPLPKVLALTTFTNHIEIMNRCRTDEERVFYMLYAAHHRLKVEELRRCIVNQTYDSLMAKEKMMSPKLLHQYEGIEFMLKDRAIVDFLKLPARHTEHRLLEQRMLYGMYPDVVTHPEDARRTLTDLANNYLYRDLLEYRGVKKPEVLQKLVRALAMQVGGEVSYNELSRLIGIDKETVESYIDLLEKCFVVFRLPTYSRNLRTEIKRGRKVYFYDNGIRNALISNFAPLDMRNDVGMLWENLMVSERVKRNAYCRNYAQMFFWRTTQQQEIDLIEEKDGRLEAYEFKWKNKDVKLPKTFVESYPGTPLNVINPGNYADFVSV